MKLLNKVLALVLVIAMASKGNVMGQDSTSLYNKILHFPDKLFKKVDDKTADINERLVRQTDKYLDRLSRQEAKLKKKLAKKDSLAAVKIFGDVKGQYAALSNSIKSTALKANSLSARYN